MKKEMPLGMAIDNSLDEMPEDFSIRPLLEANRVEVKDMLLTEYNEAKNMELFRKESHAEGRAEGEHLLSSLITDLIAQGRTEDILRAATNDEYRQKLYKEFKLA